MKVESIIAVHNIVYDLNRLLKKTGFYGDETKADEDKDPSQWLWGAVNQLTNTITSNNEEGQYLLEITFGTIRTNFI